jgi:hypothetical protein
MAYLDEGGDAHAEGEGRHGSGKSVDFVSLEPNGKSHGPCRINFLA